MRRDDCRHRTRTPLRSWPVDSCSVPRKTIKSLSNLVWGRRISRRPGGFCIMPWENLPNVEETVRVAPRNG